MFSQIKISQLVRAFAGTDKKPGVIGSAEKERQATQAASPKLARHPWSDPDKQSRRAIQIGIIVILTSIASCSAWITYAPLEGAVVGLGEVANLDHRTTIQHQEGGIISDVFVREGDSVQVGDPLVSLVDKSLEAQLGIVNSDLDKILIRKARYETERDLGDKIHFPAVLNPDDPQVENIIRTEEQGFQSSKALYQAQLDLIASQQSDLKAEIAGLNREVIQINSAYELLNAEIANAQSLVQQNYLSRNALLSLQRESANYLAQLESKRTRINRAHKQIASLDLQKQEVKAGYIDNANQQLSELKNDERVVREKITPLKDSINRQYVTASVSGEILAMESLHRGSVLPAGGRILDIVPDEDDLIIKTRISISDIDEVYSGQDVDIRFNALPARKTPLVAGTVRNISADRLVEEHTGQPYFRADVSVTNAALEHAGIGLHPGESATVFLKTQQRTMLDYFLSPIITFNEKTFRES